MVSQVMPHWLGQRAALTPNRKALITEREEWTFAELNNRALEIAYVLAEKGVKRGDHVALLLDNGLQTVAIYHALSYVGAVLVPLNIRLTAAELTWQIRDAKVRWLVFDAAHSSRATVLAQEVPDVQALLSDALAREEDWQGKGNRHLLKGDRRLPADMIQAELDLNNIHAIIYTSGTTGRPKGVMLTYSNHWWSAVGSVLNLGLEEHDRWLACLPFFHVSGLSILMRSVIYGIPVVVQETFVPQAVNEAIAQQQVTIISVVSAMLSRMLAELKEASYPQTLRCVLLGGGPAPQPLLEECVRRRVPVFQTYGLTETASQIVTLAPEYMLDKLGSAGKPLFPARLKIEKDGHALQPGEVGEIVVSGPNVTQGYFNREEATRKSIKNGWLYTGDLGYVDEEGFLYVVDRRQDLIISGGENVYPAEVEAVLLAHPDIAEAGVTGVGDERWGQVPVAFVTLKSRREIDEKDIQHFCRQRLAKYKVPTKIFIVDHLPRNATNKLMRRELLNLLPADDGQT